MSLTILSELIGLPMKELTIFLTIISHIFFSFVYRYLPVNKNSKNFNKQVKLRQLYGMVIGMGFNFLLFQWTEIVVVLISLISFYIMAVNCTTARRAFFFSFLAIVFLCMIHVNRIMHFYRENRFDINYVMTVIVPKQIYFNWYVFDFYQEQQKKGGKKEESIPSFFDYSCYTLNYIGTLVTPVYSYREYDRFIKQDYEKSEFPYKLIWTKVKEFVLSLGLFFAISMYTDTDLVEKDQFSKQSVVKQIIHICVQCLFVRCRFYIVWVLADIITITCNFRDETHNYTSFITTIDPYQTEFAPTIKGRIDNWNISIVKWLRLCFFDRLKTHTQLSTGLISSLVFFISAFWHGLYPVYYITFLLGFLSLQMGKLHFKYKSVLWPGCFLIERLYMNISMITFMRHETDRMIRVLWNFLPYLTFLFLYHFLLIMYTKRVKKRKRNKEKAD